MSAKEQDNPPRLEGYVLPHYRDPLAHVLVFMGMPNVLGYRFTWLGEELTDLKQFHRYQIEAFAISSEDVDEQYQTSFVFKAPRFNKDGYPDERHWINYYRYARRLECPKTEGFEGTPLRYEEIWSHRAQGYVSYITGFELVPLFQRAEHTALLMAGVGLLDMAGQQYGNRKGYSREEVTNKLWAALDRYASDGQSLDKINWSKFSCYFGQARTAPHYFFDKFQGLRKEFDERVAVLQKRYGKVSNK